MGCSHTHTIRQMRSCCKTNGVWYRNGQRGVVQEQTEGCGTGTDRGVWYRKGQIGVWYRNRQIGVWYRNRQRGVVQEQTEGCCQYTNRQIGVGLIHKEMDSQADRPGWAVRVAWTTMQHFGPLVEELILEQWWWTHPLQAQTHPVEIGMEKPMGTQLELQWLSWVQRKSAD